MLFRNKSYPVAGHRSPAAAQSRRTIDQWTSAASVIDDSSSSEGGAYHDGTTRGNSPSLDMSIHWPGSGFTHNDHGGYDDRCSSIKPALSHDRDYQSICYFFQTMVFNTIANYNLPYAQFLPVIYQEAKPASCLRLALKATSNINLANRLGQDPSWNAQAAIDYGFAIKATNEALRDATECVSDQTLVAVWLLGAYENLLLFSPYAQGTTNPDSNHRDWKDWLAHILGVQTLLQMRGINQFSTSRGRQLFTLLHAAIQLTCVVHGVEEPPDFSSMVDHLYNIEQMTSVASSKVMAFYREVTRLRSLMKSIMFEFPVASGQSNNDEEFLRVGQSLNIEMDDWESECGEKVSLLPSTTPVISSLSNHDQPFAMFAYQTFWGFYQSMRFHTARIMLNDALIAVLWARLIPENAALSTSSSQLSTKMQVARHKATLQVSATNIIGSVAYGIGDIDVHGRRRLPQRSYNDHDVEQVLGTKVIGGVNIVASFQLFKPLELITLLEHSSPEQKHLARLAMRRVEEEFRFRQ